MKLAPAISLSAQREAVRQHGRNDATGFALSYRAATHLSWRAWCRGGAFMLTVEMDLPAGAEAERFTAAIYRFLELNARRLTDNETIVIESFPFGGLERKRVTLWSTAAVADFQRFWRTFISDRPSVALHAQSAA
ncbi:MAG: hypothetical protein ABIO39_09285 [Caulobacteraceae bacterium]